MRPTPPNPPPRPPAVPADVERRLRELSQPGARDDAYIMAPPPVRTGPDLEAVGNRVTDVAVAATDRSVAALAHFSILFGLIGIGFVVSLAITAFIWLYSRRSSGVKFQAGQAGAYQLFVIASHIGFAVLLGVLVSASVYLQWGWAAGVAVLVPFIWVLWFLGTIAYGALGGLLVLLGRDFRYPVFGRSPRIR